MTLIQYLLLTPHNLDYYKQKTACEKYGGFITEPRTETERDFLDRLDTGPYFLGMSFVTQRWLWGSDGTEVTWPEGQQESQENKKCAVMRPQRDENDGDEFTERKGWVREGCGSKDKHSLICQRGKDG